MRSEIGSDLVLFKDSKAISGHEGGRGAHSALGVTLTRLSSSLAGQSVKLIDTTVRFLKKVSCKDV